MCCGAAHFSGPARINRDINGLLRGWCEWLGQSPQRVQGHCGTAFVQRKQPSSLAFPPYHHQQQPFLSPSAQFPPLFSIGYGIVRHHRPQLRDNPSPVITGKLRLRRLPPRPPNSPSKARLSRPNARSPSASTNKPSSFTQLPSRSCA